MPVPSVVLDTNIVVSAHLSPYGLPNRINNLALKGHLRLYVSPAILTEYETVLRRPKFPLHPKEIDESLALIRQHSTLVVPKMILSISPDEPDNRFLECAEAANADFLVTGNSRHFPQSWKKTRILTPRELIETLLVR